MDSTGNVGRPLGDAPAHLIATLLEVVSGAWLRGWQPADLARLVRRTLEPVHLRLLAAGVLAELSRYPAGSVDPRWEPQLGALRSLTAAPRSSVVERDPDLLAAAVRRLAGFVSVLPSLRPVGPLPGDHRGGPSPGADERVLGRVRVMLAKAESTTYPAEADTFTAAAQELMARHSIDLALLAARSESPSPAPGARRLGIDSPYESMKASLLDHVARANRCRAVWSRSLGFGTVVGFEADLDAVETLFTSLLVQATVAMTTLTKAGAPGDRSRTRAFRRAFLAAYAVRIGERLTEVTRAQTAASSGSPGSSAASLLPVLASRGAAVAAAVGDLFPELTTYDAGTVTDAEGYASGRLAADRAALSRALPE